MKNKKFERRNQFIEVQEQIQSISIEIYGPKEYIPAVVDETDLSMRKLEELHRQLNALQNEKVNNLLLPIFLLLFHQLNNIYFCALCHYYYLLIMAVCSFHAE